jgi:hypothetical protein
MAVKKFITKTTTEKLAKKVKALFATKAELGKETTRATTATCQSIVTELT